MMQLPWWGWTLLSVGGFTGTALISARLASTRVPSTTINIYLFAVGLVAFLLYAGLTQADFRLPPSQCWWLLPLAGTLFASNYSVVRAYQAAPNVGYVKAIGVADLVLVALVVAVLAVVQGRPVGLPWWKLAGMGLCVVGAVLVALEGRKSPPAPQPPAAGASAVPSSSAPRTPAAPRPSAPAVGSQVVAPASATSGMAFDVTVIACYACARDLVASLRPCPTSFKKNCPEPELRAAPPAHTFLAAVSRPRCS